MWSRTARRWPAYRHVDWESEIRPGSYVHALVADVAPQYAIVKFGGYQAQLGPAEIKWTKHVTAAGVSYPR